MFRSKGSISSPTVTITKKECVCRLHCPITHLVTAPTVNISPKLFASSCSTVDSMALLSNSCRRLEALREITDSRSMFL